MVNAVHVHSPHPEISGGIIEEIVSDYESQVQDSFKELESELIELKEVPHEADRFIAYLTDAIYTETISKDIDLIVMGTRAKHESMEHLLGTRATDIIESSKVPVLVIPEGYVGFQPKLIGLAVDYSKDVPRQDFSALKTVVQIFDAELLVFNISENPDQLTAGDQTIIEKLRKALDPVNASIRTVEAQSVTEGIVKFSNSHNLDLLSMMPKRHNFFQRVFKKSVTKSIAIDVEIPLLIFHES